MAVSAQSTDDSARRRRRWVASFVAAFGAILVGYDTGIIGGAILFIQPEFHLGAVEQALIITSVLIGAIVGAVISGWVAERLGRRGALVVTAAIFIVGGLVMAVAPTYGILLAARFVTGLAVGAMEATVPTFLSELAPTKSRGMVATNNQLMIATGILIAGVINLVFSEHMSWRISLGISAVPAVVLLVLLLSQPETPRWLMLKGRVDEARRVLGTLLPADEAEVAFAQLRQVSSEAASADVPGADRGPISAVAKQLGAMEIWRTPELKRLLVVGVIFAMFQQLIGINSIVYYAPTILKAVGFGTNAALVNTVGFGVLSVVMTLISGVVVDRVGRRPLLIWGAVVLAFAMIVVGAVFTFDLMGSAAGQYLALIGLAVFKGGFSLTWGPVVWVMLPELFPLRARAAGVSISTSFKVGVETLFTFFLAMLLQAAPAVMFIVFALFGFGASVFVRKEIPETSSVSLEELEERGREVGAEAGVSVRA